VINPFAKDARGHTTKSVQDFKMNSSLLEWLIERDKKRNVNSNITNVLIEN
jgi:hypothetical protein